MVLDRARRPDPGGRPPRRRHPPCAPTSAAVRAGLSRRARPP